MWVLQGWCAVVLCEGQAPSRCPPSSPAEENTPASSGSLVSAFLEQAFTTTVLCALTALERWELHPVGAGDFSTVDVTVAGEGPSAS